MNDDKKAVNDTSGQAAIARGEKAIAAQERLQEKEKDPDEAKAREKEDAKKWREEG
jgi:hypothetical protein